jgi:hypothetical protein
MYSQLGNTTLIPYDSTAGIVSITDSTFLNWFHQIQWLVGSGPYFSSYRVGTGGNGGAYLETKQYFPSGSICPQPSNYCQIGILHLQQDLIYYPTYWDIDSIDLSVDVANLTGDNGAIGFLFDLKQNNICFYDSASIRRGNLPQFSNSTWATRKSMGLRATDFTPLDSGSASGTRPDFSKNGKPILFGFHTSNSSRPYNYYTTSGIDNFVIKIYLHKQ